MKQEQICELVLSGSVCWRNIPPTCSV